MDVLGLVLEKPLAALALDWVTAALHFVFVALPFSCKSFVAVGRSALQAPLLVSFVHAHVPPKIIARYARAAVLPRTGLQRVFRVPFYRYGLPYFIAEFKL